MRICWIWIACTPLLAQHPSVVRAAGDAVVSVQPDRTLLRFAITTTAATAKRAADRNAVRAESVISSLRDLLGAAGDIRTVSYTVNPKYFDGFIADNRIEVRLHDLSLAGKVLDTALHAGATTAGALASDAPEAVAARAEALRQATEQARANAEAMASSLGLRVVRVLSAENQTPPAPLPILPFSGRSYKKTQVTTPIETAPIEIRAHVVLTLEVTK